MEESREILYSLLVYGELYESAFFILIFALSNGLILARRQFKGIEMVLFWLIAGSSFVVEIIYYDELHSFNLYVFVALALICISGAIRTFLLLRS